MPSAAKILPTDGYYRPALSWGRNMCPHQLTIQLQAPEFTLSSLQVDQSFLIPSWKESASKSHAVATML